MIMTQEIGFMTYLVRIKNIIRFASNKLVFKFYFIVWPMLNIGIYKATIKTPIIIPITTIISGSIIVERPLTTVSNSSS